MSSLVFLIVRTTDHLRVRLRIGREGKTRPESPRPQDMKSNAYWHRRSRTAAEPSGLSERLRNRGGFEGSLRSHHVRDDLNLHLDTHFHVCHKTRSARRHRPSCGGITTCGRQERPRICIAGARMNGSRTSIAIAAVVLLGAALGLGAYTFAYARGWAYLTDDPRACANCHVMNEQYDGWIKSSHRSVAVCNDCHVPHSSSPSTVTKATNGFWHSYHFTAARFPSQSGRCRRAGRSRRRIAAAATSPSSKPWGRRHTPDRATSRVSVVTGPWAIWNFPRPTFPIRRGEPCLSRNQAECAGGVAVRS